MPKISVIVPVYNVEKYIHRCVQSILNQTLTDIEIILVDDGSPDQCPAICDKYAEMDSRVRVIHKNNEGLGFARNSGLEIANGEYVAFVDSDDYVDHKMYETLYNFARDSNSDTVICGYNILNDDGLINPISEVSTSLTFGLKEEVLASLLDMVGCEPSSPLDRKYQMSVWRGIYSKSIIDTYNLRFYSERDFISEDILFHIDYLKNATKISFLPDSLYYYCHNGNSLTNSLRHDRFDKYKIMYFKLDKELSLIFDTPLI